MAYFECVIGGGGTSLTIQITTTSAVLYGQTITISKGGSTVGTTAFDNTGSAEYTVRETGTYTVSVTYSGTTFSNTVEVTDTFDTEIYATPDGSTVTPVNDIQIWLHCGDVWDKNYTTLSEVLADTTTLLALINSNNAVDYMVRSHDWCDDVCADATAMTYIGANDYAADTLLADDNPGLVPVMTGATAPYGEAFYSSGNTSNPAWKSFDGDASSFALFTNQVDNYIGYDFPNAVVVTSLYMKGDTSKGDPEFYIEGADSKTGTYTPLDTFTWSASAGEKTVSISNTTAYKSYRLRIKTVGTSGGNFGVYTLQFYAKDGSWLESICNSTYFESVLNVKVPTMTSATTPSGECLESGHHQSAVAYRAFDGDNTTEWSGATQSPYSGQYIGYKFQSAVKVYLCVYTRRNLSGYGNNNATADIQGDNQIDFSNAVTISSDITLIQTDSSYGINDKYVISSPGNYTCYRLLFKTYQGTVSQINPTCAGLQFYGRAAS